MNTLRFMFTKQMNSPILVGFLQLVFLCAACATTPKPKVHFVPEKNWMNDPNGLVYHAGEYHLFYQYNPFGNTWGHMSWGHAVSKDLVTWEQLPVALYEEDGIMIFSGSAVVDAENTSGFGDGCKVPMVAIYTGYDANRGVQQQSIAYSLDRGRTWTKYAGNPVLDLGLKDFRDPKVFWYEPGEYWIMAVALSVDRIVQFYRSDDLKEWSLLSEFGPAGAVKGIWECPDLFPLTTSSGKTKWVLEVDLGDHSVAGGSGAQYFLGDFDGVQFTADEVSTKEKFIPYDDPQATVIEDFEDGYSQWSSSGKSFGSAPAVGSLDGQNSVIGFEGRFFASGFHGGDESIGSLRSGLFKVSKDFLNFKIGGGAAPRLLEARLVDNKGEILRRETGHNLEELVWKGWDVSDLRDELVRVEIVDKAVGGWGHLSVDQFELSDTRAEEVPEWTNWLDYGKDFYAAVTWSNVPKDRKIWIGWMSNWQYANETPTEGWRSAMSIPREVSLVEVGGELRLKQEPVQELLKYRGDAIHHETLSITEDSTVVEGPGGVAADIELSILPGKESAGVGIFTGDGKSVRIGYDSNEGVVFFDRTEPGIERFHAQFAGRYTMPVAMVDGVVSLRIIVDRCSIEVFAEDGTRCMSNLIFPEPKLEQVEVFGRGAQIASLKIYPLEANR